MRTKLGASIAAAEGEPVNKTCTVAWKKEPWITTVSAYSSPYQMPDLETFTS
jgi:hypothetical protein